MVRKQVKEKELKGKMTKITSGEKLKQNKIKEGGLLTNKPAKGNIIYGK